MNSKIIFTVLAIIFSIGGVVYYATPEKDQEAQKSTIKMPSSKKGELSEKTTQAGKTISSTDGWREIGVAIGSEGWNIFELSNYQPEVVTTNVFGNEVQAIKLMSVDHDQSGIQKQLTIPQNVDLFSFKAHFLSGGDGDWITVHFGEGVDRLLWSFRGDVASGLQEFSDEPYVVDADIVDVRSYAGETNEMFIILHGAGPKQAEILLTDFQFTRK